MISAIFKFLAEYDAWVSRWASRKAFVTKMVCMWA